MRNSRPGGITRGICLGLVLQWLSATGAWSQDDTAAPDAATAKPPAQDANAQNGKAERASSEEPGLKVDTSRRPDRFIPTEEISEDFSVSFPADI